MIPPVTRRRALSALGLGVGLAWAGHGTARAHAGLGPVTPRRPAPALPLTLHDGRSSTLPRALQGRVTAVQLMFTGCNARCPVQGAIFGQLQERLGTLPDAQLLSLTLDPLSDDAPRLKAWLQRHQAGPRWLAAAPPVRQADVMLDFLEGRDQGADRHTAQVVLFDRQARLAYRLAPLAGPADIAAGLRELAARG